MTKMTSKDIRSQGHRVESWFAGTFLDGVVAFVVSQVFLDYIWSAPLHSHTPGGQTLLVHTASMYAFTELKYHALNEHTLENSYSICLHHRAYSWVLSP